MVYSDNTMALKPLEKRGAPIKQIVKLEKEMSQVQASYKDAKEN
jgi:hypothetical protein